MDPGKWYEPNVGWNKGWGIFHSISSGLAIHLFGYDSDEAREYVRQLDLGLTGRGENQPPPGNYAVSASDCVYIHYLLRGLALEDNHVAILVGKLPTTPRTRNSEPVMQSAEARYWSITGYDPRIDTSIPGTAATFRTGISDSGLLRRIGHPVSKKPG